MGSSVSRWSLDLEVDRGRGSETFGNCRGRGGGGGGGGGCVGG